MTIAVLGTIGFVGNVLIQKAISQCCEIKIMARNPEKLNDLRI
jgi:putative NADH-flavin reductase